MTDDKFPLCKKAGFELYKELSDYEPDYVISANEIESFLEKTPVVYSWPNKSALGWHEGKLTSDTHAAKLILIEPIAKDTTDSLLRELVKGYTDCGTNRDAADFTENIIERARKILWEDR